MWWVIPMLPLLALLPGDLGKLFRTIQSIIGWCVIIVVLTVVWSGAVLYQGSKCWAGGDILACERAHGLFTLPAEPFKLAYGVFHSTPELQAAHDREMAQWRLDDARQQAMTDEQRDHAKNEHLLNGYNKRNGTTYILTADNRVVIAPPAPVLTPTQQYALDEYNLRHHTSFRVGSDGRTLIDAPR